MATPFPGTVWKITDSSGAPINGAKIYTYSAGTLTAKAAYTTSAFTTATSNPIITGADGTARFYLGPGAYRIRVFDATDVELTSYADDNMISQTDPSTDLATATDVALGDALVAVKTTQTGSVATTQHDWNEAQTLNTKANFAIPADGTDQTSAIVALMSTLSGYRGSLDIAPGTVFVPQTVVAAIPTGLRVNSSSTWADGSYNQKFTVRFNGDLVTDDSQVVEGSHYHPTRAYWNTGRNTTDKDDSAARRYASEAHWVGYTADFNGPVIGWFEQWGKHPSLNRWRKSWRLQSKLLIAMGDTHGKWITGKPYVTAEQVRNSTGAIYRATNTATSGATEPTGTGSSISDGAVTWAYVQPGSVAALRVPSAVYGVGARILADDYKVYKATTGGTVTSGSGPTGTGTGIADGTAVWDYEQAALAVDQTRMDLDENGNVGMYSPAGAPQRLTMQSGARSHYLEIDDTSNDVTWRDESRGVDIWESSTTGGVRSGRLQSFNLASTTVSASGTLALTAPMHYLTASGGPWDISDITLPSGQTSGTVTLWFAGTNLVLKNNAAIVTRTGADITSAANMMVTLYKDTAITSAWVVLSKN
jgi:hypothetical protein